MQTQRILVVGGGIGGLTAALALLRQGFAVTVLEQAAQWKEVGAGIQLSANAVRALWQLGLRDALEAVASRPGRKEIRLWNTGQTWKLFDLGAESVQRYGYPYYMLHRADLHGALVDAVRQLDPDCLRLVSPVRGVGEEDGQAWVQLEDGTRLFGHAVVGADGVHSTVRRKLFDESGLDGTEFSGCVAWRGVIPAAALPAHLREPVGVNWVGPGGHVIHYPLRRGELINFVGIVESSGWEVESWTQQGDIEECLADFAGWHEDVQTLIRHVPTAFKWALMVREPMQCWHQGRIALMGDAAHPTLPFLAQGAAMAIEDGYVLARCLAKYPDDPAQAWQAYEHARLERTSRVVRGSAENARRFHNPVLAHAEGAAAYVDREWSRERVLERYEWLFRYDVDTVPIA